MTRGYRRGGFRGRERGREGKKTEDVLAELHKHFSQNVFVLNVYYTASLTGLQIGIYTFVKICQCVAIVVS